MQVHIFGVATVTMQRSLPAHIYSQVTFYIRGYFKFVHGHVQGYCNLQARLNVTTYSTTKTQLFSLQTVHIKFFFVLMEVVGKCFVCL